MPSAPGIAASTFRRCIFHRSSVNGSPRLLRATLVASVIVHDISGSVDTNHVPDSDRTAFAATALATVGREFCNDDNDYTNHVLVEATRHAAIVTIANGIRESIANWRRWRQDRRARAATTIAMNWRRCRPFFRKRRRARAATTIAMNWRQCRPFFRKRRRARAETTVARFICRFLARRRISKERETEERLQREAEERLIREDRQLEHEHSLEIEEEQQAERLQRAIDEENERINDEEARELDRVFEEENAAPTSRQVSESNNEFYNGADDESVNSTVAREASRDSERGDNFPCADDDDELITTTPESTIPKRRSERIQEAETRKSSALEIERESSDLEVESVARSMRRVKKKATMFSLFDKDPCDNLLLPPKQAEELVNALPENTSHKWLVGKVDEIIRLKDELDDATDTVTDFEAVINHIAFKDAKGWELKPKERQLVDRLYATNTPECDSLKDKIYYVTCLFARRLIKSNRIILRPFDEKNKYDKKQAENVNQRVDLRYLINHNMSFAKYLEDSSRSETMIEHDLSFTIAIAAQTIIFSTKLKTNPLLVIRLGRMISPKQAMLLGGYITKKTKSDLNKKKVDGRRKVRDDMPSWYELEFNTKCMLESQETRYAANSNCTAISAEDTMAHYDKDFSLPDETENNDAKKNDNKNHYDDDDDDDDDDGDDESVFYDAQQTPAGQAIKLEGPTLFALNRKRKGKNGKSDDGRDKRGTCLFNRPKNTLPMAIERANKRKERDVCNETEEECRVVEVTVPKCTNADIMLNYAMVEAQVRAKHIFHLPLKEGALLGNLFHYNDSSERPCCPTPFETFNRQSIVSKMFLESDSQDNDMMALFSCQNLANTAIMKVGQGIDPFYYNRFRNPPLTTGARPGYLVVSAKKGSTSDKLLAHHHKRASLFALFADEDDKSDDVVFAGYGKVIAKDFEEVSQHAGWRQFANNDERAQLLSNDYAKRTFYAFKFISYDTMELLPYKVDGRSNSEGTWKYRKVEKRVLEFKPSVSFAVPESKLTTNGGNIHLRNILDDIRMSKSAFIKAFHAEWTQSGRSSFKLTDEPDQYGLTLSDLERK